MLKLNSKQIKEKIALFKKAYKEHFNEDPDPEFVKSVMAEAAEKSKRKYILGYLTDFHGKTIIDINSQLNSKEVKDAKAVNSVSNNKQPTSDKSRKSGAPLQDNRTSRKVSRKKGAKAPRPKDK